MCDSIPKPKMRGLLAAQNRKTLPIAIGLAMLQTLAYKIFVNDKRKKAYRDYYLDYDPEVSEEYMAKHLQSRGNWNPS